MTHPAGVPQQQQRQLITPFRGLLIHLILTGYPSRFGLVPIGIRACQSWLGLPSPCSFIFDDENCSAIEHFAIQDAGYRFFLVYELALVALFVMAMVKPQNNNKEQQQKNSKQNEVYYCRFHKTLVTTSFLTLLTMAWLQHYHVKSASLDPDYFATTVLYYLVAIAISLWTMTTQKGRDNNNNNTIYEKQDATAAAWSIPGCAIMTGAAVNILIAIASIQALVLNHDGIGQYYNIKEENGKDPTTTTIISPIMRTSLYLGILHTILHANMLMSLRDIMTLQQLKALCLYKAIVNVVMPLVFWFPEVSEFVNIPVGGAITLRACLMCVYAFGYIFSGQAEEVSTILTGEKAD